jgi:hypothetical protein
VKWLPGFGYHDGAGDTIDYGAYHEVFLSGYGELGIFEGGAVWLHAPLVQTFTLHDPRPSGEGETRVHPGDPTLGARLRFLQVDRFVAAADVSATFPIAPDDPKQTVYAADDPHREIGALRVGSGVFDFAGALSVGYGWDAVYVAAAGGYVARTGSFDHLLRWSAEVGATFSARLSGRLRLTGQHTLDTGDAPRTESPSGIGNGTSYAGFALEGETMIVPDWFVGLTFEGGLFRIRRQTGGPVLSLFVATKF